MTTSALIAELEKADEQKHLPNNGRVTVRPFNIRRWQEGAVERVTDAVAVEEPLEIRLAYRFKDAAVTQSLALAMRTPGQDRELTAGLLLSEGVITSREDIVGIRELGPDGKNEIVVELAPHVDVEHWRLHRNTVLSSSCGICGKASRESIVPGLDAGVAKFEMDAAVLYLLPEQLRTQQEGFAQTGGLHAAALFDVNGTLLAAFEDIGRHNALDKLLGRLLLEDDLPVGDRVVFLSSRGSFELVQKTVMAGGRFLATVGGPSSLAIETARSFDVTLAGFVRERRCNVYAGEWRIHSK